MSGDLRQVNCRRLFSSTSGLTIYKEFVYPSLEQAIKYDRKTGYFSVAALQAAALGIESLIRRGGTMRLIIGIHDLDKDLLEAIELGKQDAEGVLSYYSERFVTDLKMISSEMAKRDMRIIAWLIQQNKLEVKFAASINPKGIFHSKSFYFEDEIGNKVHGIGSINETGASNAHSEDLSISRSWIEGNEFSDYQDDFPSTWEGRNPDVKIIDVSAELAKQLLETIEDDQEQRRIFEHDFGIHFVSNALQLLRVTPDFALLNSTNVLPYPHQERVYLAAVDRWPVRALFADEVGLGKTLEVGLVISTLLKMQKEMPVMILAPKGLLDQWQDELSVRFGLNFAIWNSSIKTFSYNKSDPLKKDFIDWKKLDVPRILVSAQWARSNLELIESALPELLVLDEAHAARLHETQKGMRSTLLLQAMEKIAPKIPHLLLATATPMQANPSEFWALLKLIGLGQYWSDYKKYKYSLEFLAANNDSISSLNDCADIANLIIESSTIYKWQPPLATESDLDYVAELKKLYEIDIFDAATFVQNNQVLCRRLLTLWHPASHIVLRNTKSALSRFGYKFPVRKLVAPELKMEGPLLNFQRTVSSYLHDNYGLVEKAIDPEKFNAMGFVALGYMQRMVSSLYSCEQTITRRLNRIEDLSARLSTKDIDVSMISYDEIIDDDFDLGEEFSSFSVHSIKRNSLSNIRAACQIESASLKTILQLLADLPLGIIRGDPKMQELTKLLSTKEILPVLVFSRYTDTLKAALDVHEFLFSNTKRTYGLYTGSESYYVKDGKRRDVTKTDLKDLLETGELMTLFCSDAASEGLNLQAAHSLINIDVPWNPARLEQRIGRIARLGQKADEVSIFNLWYPESVEARMYQKLMEKRELFELAVGEFPDIVADSIRQSITGEFGPGEIDLAMHNLEEIRSSDQIVALQKVLSQQNHEGELQRHSEILRSELLQIFLGSGLSQKNKNYDPCLQFLGIDDGQFLNLVIKSMLKEKGNYLYGVMRSNELIGFAIETEDGYLPVTFIETTSIIRLMLGISISVNSSENAFKDLNSLSSHLIDRNELGAKFTSVDYSSFTEPTSQTFNTLVITTLIPVGRG